MNIYELNKQATPAPWTHESGMIDVSDQAQMLLDNIGTEREWQAIGINDPEGFAEVTALCHPNHAKLLKHCRNHFMEALEALKKEHKVTVGYEEDFAHASPHCPEICDVCQLIKKMETIE